jgi:NAD(P)-dependent dehydrogenase (short-subunit alcohol dehydrogenase family)
VTDVPSVAQAFQNVQRNLGPVGIAIYNVGKGVWGDALSIPVEDYENAWRINSPGALLVAQRGPQASVRSASELFRRQSAVVFSTEGAPDSKHTR